MKFENYIIPTLTVKNAAVAIVFYQKAFGAVVEMSDDDPATATVAQMAIGAARFVVSNESPEHGNLAPGKAAGVSIRIGLMVDDPDTLAKNAVAAGATAVYAVADQDYGYRLGHVIDPFGHHWEIGKPLR